jgi:hypothetical protein
MEAAMLSEGPVGSPFLGGVTVLPRLPFKKNLRSHFPILLLFFLQVRSRATPSGALIRKFREIQEVHLVITGSFLFSLFLFLLSFVNLT